MIHTPLCDLLRIRHPIVLGGMAGGTSVPLVAAVSNAGGLGTLGIARTPAEEIPKDIAAIRDTTKRPFGVNFLLFVARQPAIDAALNATPPVFSAAWARADQDLRALFGRAHEAGSQVMYMAGTVPEALRAKAAGADVIVAQGTEGGGHVGWMASMVVLPMIVDAVGFSRPEYEAAGLPYDPPGVRVDRFAEALQVFKGLFGAEPFTFCGRFYTVTDLDSFPNPVQRPRPPILVGAGGRRMLSIGAREANIIGILTAALGTGRRVPDPSGLLAEIIAEKIGWIRQEAGSRFDDIELSIVSSVVIAENRREAAERLAREREWDGMSADRVLEMPSIFIGSVDQIADEMQARRERSGISYHVVSDRSMEMVAPIVARLAGV